MTQKSILRSYRESIGYSTTEFARWLGIPSTTLRSMENGWRPITPHRAKWFEEKTNGALTRAKLVPELFADLPKPKKATA